MLTSYATGYPGGHIFVYDTKTKEARDLGMPIEFQGVRLMALDKVRGHLYGLGALDNYLFHYDIKAGTSTIVGKVASYNGYGMAVDQRDGTMYTSDGTGHMIAYRAGWPKIRRLAVTIPGAGDPETSLVTVFIAAPDGTFYGMDHAVKHLFRFDPTVPPEGKITDLGRLLGEGRDYYVVESLAFDSRGTLFALVPTLEEKESGQTFAVTTDTKTGEKKVWGALDCRGERMNGCYRMTAGPDGSLYAGSRMDGVAGSMGRKKIERQGAFWLLRIKPDSIFSRKTRQNSAKLGTQYPSPNFLNSEPICGGYFGRVPGARISTTAFSIRRRLVSGFLAPSIADLLEHEQEVAFSAHP